MDYEIHVIEQDPIGLAVPLDVGRVETRLRESLLYLIRDGLDLARVATAANNKVVGKPGGSLVQFENGDVASLLGFGGGDGGGDLVL